ncbi:hypothetical protein DDZ18_05440 [Marinicauda salina]|uniref:DUF192 domain-containing protein n=1 Tax=Marinicauda salina TaxID=2135793 RepID=A0A2U2BVG1_9PROT|nr:DUF192 domain-containing protein [Marinicauda salina]PWE18016.1 hypothetical protein DDZ18_05440 [Marinicauda salina]
MTRLIALFAAFAFATASAAAQPVDPTARDAVVEYGGPEPVVVETDAGPVRFSAEIADTPASRQRGMMWRESIAPDEAMLFDFGQVRPVTIWMRNTLIPLDIVYIRADGTIAKVVAHAQPRSLRQLPSDFPVIGVLEIAGGRAAQAGIAPGDLVRHAMFGTTEADAPETEAPADADASEGGEG